MDTNNGVKMPEIRTDVRRREDEKKGAGVGLLAKLGLGGSQAAGGAGGLAAGGGLLAGKAGVVALIMAGSSVAAGIGLLSYSGSSRGPQAGGSVFSRSEGAAPAADSAEGAVAQAVAPADGMSASLENFNRANQGAVPDPYAPRTEEAVQDAAGPAQVGATEVPDNTTTPSQGTAPPSGSVNRPRMAKSSGFAGAKGGGSSGASGGGVLSARGPGGASDLSRGAAGASTALRGGAKTAAASRKSAVMRGGGATSQLRAHSGVLKRNVASGNVSSQASGAVMDGAAPAGAIGAAGGQITGGGAGTGGQGIDSSASKSMSTNLKEVEPPPSPEAKKKGENKTLYQKYMVAGIAALGLSVVLLVALGFIKQKIKAAFAATPVSGPAIASLVTTAKWVAGAATAAAAVATAMGIAIMTKFPTERMPGMILTGVGALLTFQAAYRFANILSIDTEDPGALAKMKAEAVTSKFAGFNFGEIFGAGAT